MADESIAVTSITNRNLWVQTTPDAAAGAGAQVVGLRELPLMHWHIWLQNTPPNGLDIAIVNPTASGRNVRIVQARLFAYGLAGYDQSGALAAAQELFMERHEGETALPDAGGAQQIKRMLNSAVDSFTAAGILLGYGHTAGFSSTAHDALYAPFNYPPIGTNNDFMAFDLSRHLPFYEIRPNESVGISTAVDYNSIKARWDLLLSLDKA